MKIYMDDERNLPIDFNILVRSVDICIELIIKLNGKIECLSLDHDMGSILKTGYNVALFLEENSFNGTLKEIPNLMCHSQNPVGKTRIEQSFEKCKKNWLNTKRKTMNTVNVRIKNNKIMKVDHQDEDIQIPDLYGKEKMVWIYEKLTEKGYILNGNNMKIIPFN